MGWAEAFPAGLLPGNTWPAFGAPSLGHFGWDNTVLRGDTVATYCGPFYLLKLIQCKRLSRYNWQLCRAEHASGIRLTCSQQPAVLPGYRSLASSAATQVFLGRTAAVTWCWPFWKDPWAACPSSCHTAHETRGGARPLLGTRVCIIQASVLPLVTHLLPLVLPWGQTRACYNGDKLEGTTEHTETKLKNATPQTLCKVHAWQPGQIL